MLEIIIGLLLNLGISLGDGTNVNVIDQETGICYGVGSTIIITQGVTPPPPPTYILMKDAEGNYYLVRR